MKTSRRPQAPALNIALATYSSGWGGAEVHTLQLATTLALRGHAVTLLELDQPSYSTRVDLASRGIRSETKLGHADVTVLVKGGFGHGSLAFDLTARRRSAVYLTIEHTMPPSPRSVPGPRKSGDPMRYPLTRHRWRLMRALELIHPRLRVGIGSETICVSDAIRFQLETAYGFPVRKLRVVRNGVDASRFVPSTERRQAARVAWRIPESAIVIGTLSRLHRAKGVSETLDSAARIMSHRPERDVRVVIVGDGDERAALCAQAGDLGITSKTVFVGPTDQPELAYPGFDIFALSSFSEGLPLALLEAMSTGLLPVCTAVGGIPDVITGPALGWSVPLGDSEALYTALLDAVDIEPPERAVIGTRCRARIMDSFNSTVTMEVLAGIIEAAVTR